ncbi:hypothetical protein ARMGADRAFT_434672 [Armillaria gallica]|uniref:Uncharacterized protein n=1 Tax=Armillaria gallica TaxID=47427 RepID=A0A2H3CYX3_ARMGA|nr:hypothetical protein ARMGADRAFT_434672 [Armillaria gallica]
MAGGAPQKFHTELNLSTSHDINDNHNQGLFTYSRLSYYPFDWYQTTVSLSPQDALTSEGLVLELGWSSRTVVDLQMNIPVSYIGIWDKSSKFVYLDLTIQRNTLVIVYCLVITFTFCLSSLLTLL